MFEQSEQYTGWVCNACKTPPPIVNGAQFYQVHNGEAEVETSDSIPLDRWVM